MTITAKKIDNGVNVSITGKIACDLAAEDIPTATIKGASVLNINIDATVSAQGPALQLHNLIARQQVASLAKITNARGLAIYVAAAADAVTVADDAVIVFDNLPKGGTAHEMIVDRLAKRLGVEAASIKNWFATGKRMSAAEASALFARPNGLNATALLNRDGSISPEKVFAKWNAPKG